MSETEQSFDLSAFGTRIREIRVNRGLSQRNLGVLIANQVGRRNHYSQAAISDLERGKPSSIAIEPEVFATVLQVPIETVTEVLSEEQINQLRERATAQREIDRIRYPRNLEEAAKRKSFAEKARFLPVSPSRRPISPVERLLVRRLERLFSNPSIDNGIKTRLTQIISSQIDLVEDLT